MCANAYVLEECLLRKNDDGAPTSSLGAAPEETPSAARIYDYLLGGYHNFEVDRAVAREFVKILPRAPLIMRANRAFVRRVVGFLVSQGVDQFLDIGSGIPTVGNVHEIAQAMDPAARVVYVDVDPVAVRHSEEILKGNANTAVIQADARQARAILDHPEVSRLLDLGRPTAVLIASVLLFLPDDDEAYRVWSARCATPWRRGATSASRTRRSKARLGRRRRKASNCTLPPATP